MQNVLKIHPNDNVWVALKDLIPGEVVHFNSQSVTITTLVPAKHKFAAHNLSVGDDVFMYGVVVGKAMNNICIGEQITVENVKHQSTAVKSKKTITQWTPPSIDKWKNVTFMGYHRPDGQVGTANVWLFFPLVFCENKNIEKLKDAFQILFPKNNNPYKSLLNSLINGNKEESNFNANSDLNSLIDIKFITHSGGCGGIRQDSESLAKLLSGYVNNPNVAGATVLSLGCQNLQVDLFQSTLNKLNPNLQKEVLVFEQQKIGTIEAMMNQVIKDSYQAILRASKLTRKPTPLSKLTIGLECGGSDGFSGISANPTLGYVSDIIVALGGTTVLAEFPELCGVEQELVDSCLTNESANKFLNLMKAYEASVINAGSGFDMNPSPGNIKDGLITDAMKSAGAAKKGGSSPIVDVLDYAEYIKVPGLNLLNTPGNDVESTTALAGSGTNLILFTTGLGTPTGNPICPVIKVASNSSLTNRMADIIDFNCGEVIEGQKTIEQVGDELLELIIQIASGTKSTKATLLEQDDFIPWKRGVSL
jgi:altronate hydrolase